MPIRIDNPHELGADRLVNAVAAHAKVKGACVTVDFGKEDWPIHLAAGYVGSTKDEEEGGVDLEATIAELNQRFLDALAAAL